MEGTHKKTGRHMMLKEVLRRYATLRDLSDRTVQIYGESIAQFAKFLGHEPTVDDLEDMAVAEFIRWRAKQTRGTRLISPETVTKDRTHILCLWTFTCKKKLHPTGEWPGLPKRHRITHTPDAYTAEDIQKLVIASRYRIGRIAGRPAGWWWPGLIMALFQTGERIGAVMATRWSDVDLERGWITFRASTRKGRSEDNVKRISPELVAWLKQHAGMPNELVWPWDRLPRSIYASWRVLCEKAGVRNRAFHAFRKSSCSYVHAAGGDATAHAMHADPEMTLRHYLDPKITGRGSSLALLPKIDMGPCADETESPDAEFVPEDAA